VEDSRRPYVRAHICTAVGQEMGIFTTENVSFFSGEKTDQSQSYPEAWQREGSGEMQPDPSL